MSTLLIGVQIAADIESIPTPEEFGKQLADKHIGMVNEVISDFMDSRPEVPNREQQLEAQIADLRKQLRDVENERDVRGTILEQLVGIRQELIDTESNSWIDSIEKIRASIIDGRGFHDQLERAHRDIEKFKADKASINQTFDDTLNMIWAVVSPDGGSWDYPAQVVRYVQDVVGDRDQKIERLNEELRVTEELLNAHERLLDAIPECEVHGRCIPHAVDWVIQAKAVMEIGKYLEGVEPQQTEHIGTGRDPWANNPQARPMPHPGT